MAAAGAWQDEASFVVSLLAANERDWRSALEARRTELERRAVQSCLSVVGQAPGDAGGLQVVFSHAAMGGKVTITCPCIASAFQR